VIQNRSALRGWYNQFEIYYKLLYVCANIKYIYDIYDIYLAMTILKQKASEVTSFRNTIF